jgi:alpha-L-fucosidase
MKKILIVCFTALMAFYSNAQNSEQTKSTGDSNLLPPFPLIPAKQPLGSVLMGDWQSFPEMKLDIPIAPGAF